MKESDWISSTDPAEMLRWLNTSRMGDSANLPMQPCQVVPSDRKLRLFACACCRQVWHLLTDERSRRAVEMAEQFADGEVSFEAMGHSRSKALEAAEFDSVTFLPVHSCDPHIESSLQVFNRRVDKAVQAALLRCIFGNPFLPSPLAWEDGKLCVYRGSAMHGMHLSPTPYYEPVNWLTWNNGVIPAMAKSIYDSRRFEEMPILADALEEAGCTDREILNHCRGLVRCSHHTVKATPIGEWPNSMSVLSCDDCHGTGWVKSAVVSVRGDWVLDLLLNQE